MIQPSDSFTHTVNTVTCSRTKLAILLLFIYALSYLSIHHHASLDDMLRNTLFPLRWFQTADLTDAKCWNNVVDFRWHRTTKSPHWHVLPPGTTNRFGRTFSMGCLHTLPVLLRIFDSTHL